MAELNASIPMSFQNPGIMSPAQAISLQQMVQQSQMQKVQFQQQQEQIQKEKKRTADLQTFYQKGPEVIDQNTGLVTPRGIVDLWQIDPDRAQQAIKDRSTAMKTSAAEAKLEIDTEIKKYKEQGEVFQNVLKGAYADYSSAKGDSEQKNQAYKTSLQKQVNELIESGQASRMGIKKETLYKLLSDAPAPDTVPLRISNIQGMIARTDAANIAGALDTPTVKPVQQNQPAEPTPLGQPQTTTLANIAGQSPNTPREYTKDGVVVSQSQSLADVGQPKPNDNRLPEQEVIGKPGLETPDELRAKAQKLERLGTPAAIKQSNAYRAQADKLDNTIGREQHRENQDRNAAEREARLTAARNDSSKDIRPEDATRIARQYLNGDRQASQGFARNAKAQAQIAQAITDEAKKQKKSPEEITTIQAEYKGLNAAETTLGHREATASMAVQEAKNMGPLVLEASRGVKRTEFQDINKIIMAGQQRTGDPNVVKLGIAINSFINIYSRAVSPTGTPTVSDKDHAREILQGSWSQGQIESGMKQLEKEMDAAIASPGQVRKQLRDEHSGQGPKKQETKSLHWDDLK